MAAAQQTRPSPSQCVVRQHSGKKDPYRGWQAGHLRGLRPAAMWPGAKALRAAVVQMMATAAADTAAHAACSAHDVRRPRPPQDPRGGPRVLRLQVRPATVDTVVSGRRRRSRQVEARVAARSRRAHARENVRPGPAAGDGGCPATVVASARESRGVSAGAALRRRRRRPDLPAVRPARRRQLRLLRLPYGWRSAR